MDKKAKKPKRNYKALRRLRAVFREVPEALVSMDTATGRPSHCGTAGCLLFWAYRDRECQKLLNEFPLSHDRCEFGLTHTEGRKLFAFASAYAGDRRKITKAQALRSLDAAIAGKRIRPYVLSPTGA